MRYSAAQTSKHHEEILKVASRLFRERGFKGVTVAEIMEAAGLTHGAFYSHFGSKDELAAAAADSALLETLARLEVAMGTSHPSETFAKGYLSDAHCQSVGAGCVVAALGAEIARGHPASKPVTARLREFIARYGKALNRRREKDRRAEAIRHLSLMMGALVLARAVDDQELAREVLGAAREAFTREPSD